MLAYSLLDWILARVVVAVLSCENVTSSFTCEMACSKAACVAAGGAGVLGGTVVSTTLAATLSDFSACKKRFHQGEPVAELVELVHFAVTCVHS